MKIEINHAPENIKEKFPGSFSVISWQEIVTAIPQAISVVTTYKESGAPNACPQAWTLYSSGGPGFYIVFSVMKRTHTYKNILRDKEFVFNFPTANLFRKCMDTIRQTGEDIDEITSCGMTVEPAKIVRAPRIKECFVNLECRLAWRRPLHKGSLFHIFAGEVVNIAIDSEKAKLNSNGRYDNDGYIFNLHSPTDPTTGEQEPDKLGIIKPLCNMENL